MADLHDLQTRAVEVAKAVGESKGQQGDLLDGIRDGLSAVTVAQPLSQLAATPAGVSPGEAGEALPLDLTALSLEQLMALRVGGRAPQDPDDALPDDWLPTLAASPGLEGVSKPTGTPGQGTDDLPADLTALSLLQLMNLPVRAPDAEEDEEPELAEEAAEEVEAGADVAQVQDQEDAENPAPEANDGGAAFSAADLGEVDGELPQDLVFMLALEGDDPLGDGDSSASEAGVAPLNFLVSANDAGGGSAVAFDPGGSSSQGAPGGAGPGPGPGNQAPVAADDTALTAPDTPLVLTVLGNDSDPDGDPLGVAVVTQGANGTVAVNPDGTLLYTPNPGFTGADSFTYTVTDGNGGTDTAGVALYVGNATEGGPGNDSLTGGPGTDVILGHGGDDTISGASGDDLLYGGDGDDALSGASGHDVLFGGAGDDTLSGAAGNDVLYGGSGDDTLDGASGADQLYGGAGDDLLIWNGSDAVVDGGDGMDTLVAAGADIDLSVFGGTLTSIENIELSGDGAGTSVVLDAQDVLDMSDTDTLTIAGDLGDSVDAGSGWTDGGIVGGIHVYTQGLATLNLDIDLSVNPDITS